MKRFLVTVLFGTGFAWAASDVSVDQASARVKQLASQLPQTLEAEYLVFAAEALKARHPDLASKFVHAALEDIQSREKIDPQLLDDLTMADPDQIIALLPKLPVGSDLFVLNALLRNNQVERAADLYRASFAKGQPRVEPRVFQVLAKENPEQAKKLFAEMLAAFSYDKAAPRDLYDLIACAVAVSPAAPDLAGQVYDRVLTIATAPDYGTKGGPRDIRATFKVDSSQIVTDNSRDTLLVAAGARLRALSPDQFEKHKDALSKWNLSGTLTQTRMGFGGPLPKREASPESAIYDRMRTLRSLSDEERPKAVLDLARTIETLPKGEKLGPASSLSNLATEGDNGKEAMDAVAHALGEGLQENPSATARDYIELAQLIRYEHARAPFSDPALDAADALLTLRARVYQDNGFSLVSMDGKTYALDQLRGKVVLLNFWATWCPPCRKEMPDMETLYRRYGKDKLVVLGVSDEDRDTVAGFLEKSKYSFPILLDPGREVNRAFGVEGIPKSFIFDAQGKLVALAIDMRTERQFLELLKEAGLQ